MPNPTSSESSTAMVVAAAAGRKRKDGPGGGGGARTSGTAVANRRKAAGGGAGGNRRTQHASRPGQSLTGRVNLYDAVLEWRRRYNKRVEQLPVLRQQLVRLQLQIEKLPRDPSHIFDMRNLKEQLRRLQFAIKRLESREDEAAFVQESKPMVDQVSRLRSLQRNLRQTNSTDYQALERSIAAVQSQFLCRFLPDKQTAELFDDDACSKCHQPLCYAETEAKLICSRCASARDCLSIIQPQNEESERSNSSEERLKHFRNWIRQFRDGIEEPPNSVVLSVKLALMRRNIKSVHEVRASPIKQILRELGLREYIDRSARIAARLNGTPVPAFSQEEIDIFIKLYAEIGTPFQQLKEGTRHNFPSSSLLINRWCRLLGLHHFEPCYSFLKAEDKLLTTDELWERICKNRGWKYERCM